MVRANACCDGNLELLGLLEALGSKVTWVEAEEKLASILDLAVGSM